MMHRKIIICLFSVFLILSFFSAVADFGRDTATDLASAQDRTRSVEDRLSAIRTMGQSGDGKEFGSPASHAQGQGRGPKGPGRGCHSSGGVRQAEAKSLKPMKRYIGTVRPVRTSAIRFFSPSAR